MYCLVDCDSFYAYCEVLRNPSLRWKSVCISREKDIVLAATYEAKKLGVKTGTASWDAKKILGSAGVFIPPDFARYASISDRLNELLSSFTNGIEVFSIDESFCDITWLAEQYEMTYEKFANRLKRKIKKEIGIPVSIGVAKTKLLAKLFSDVNKPYGQFAGLEEDEVDEVLKKLDMEKVCFLGHARSFKLKGHGMSTAYDVKSVEQHKIKKLLWADGLKIRMELNGWDVMSFAHKVVPKSITRSRSFHPHFTSDKELLRSHLMSNFEKAYAQMLSHKLSTKYIKVKLRDVDFRSHSQEMNIDNYCNDKKELLRYIQILFDEGYKSSIKYRTTGVVFGSLKDTTMYHKDDLFTYHITQSNNKIYKAMSDLNTRFGKNLVGTAWGYVESKDKKELTSMDKTIAFEVG